MTIKILLLCLVILISFPSVGTCDMEAVPEDYKIVSSNEKYVFVMLAPPDWFHDKKLRKLYSKSGLYKNDETTVPLWIFEQVIDWRPQGTYLSSDGKYLVILGPWARVWHDKDLEKGGPALNQLGVSFFKEGKLLKSYSIGELIEDATKLPQTASHFNWRQKVSFDETNNHFMIQTLEGQKILFDVSTGEIIEKIQDTSLIRKVDRALR